MNTHQALRRIKSILQGLLWGGTGDNVFARGSVRVTLRTTFESLGQIRKPAAFIAPIGATVDPNIPTLIKRRIRVSVLTSAAGDQFGEAPLMGRNRTSATSNEGRGMTEIEAELLGAISKLNADDSFPIILKAISGAVPIIDEDEYHIGGEYEFEATLGTAYENLHPRQASASDSGGTVTFSWAAPDDVTNLVTYIVRRTSGTIPVYQPDAGDSVTYSSGTSVTDTPGSGTWSYSVFAVYDSLGGSVQHEFSDYSFDTVVVA